MSWHLRKRMNDMVEQGYRDFEEREEKIKRMTPEEVLTLQKSEAKESKGTMNGLLHVLRVLLATMVMLVALFLLLNFLGY